MSHARPNCPHKANIRQGYVMYAGSSVENRTETSTSASKQFSLFDQDYFGLSVKLNELFSCDEEEDDYVNEAYPYDTVPVAEAVLKLASRATIDSLETSDESCAYFDSTPISLNQNNCQPTASSSLTSAYVSGSANFGEACTRFPQQHSVSASAQASNFNTSSRGNARESIINGSCWVNPALNGNKSRFGGLSSPISSPSISKPVASEQSNEPFSIAQKLFNTGVQSAVIVNTIDRQERVQTTAQSIFGTPIINNDHLNDTSHNNVVVNNSNLGAVTSASSIFDFGSNSACSSSDSSSRTVSPLRASLQSPIRTAIINNAASQASNNSPNTLAATFRHSNHTLNQGFGSQHLNLSTKSSNISSGSQISGNVEMNTSVVIDQKQVLGAFERLMNFKHVKSLQQHQQSSSPVMVRHQQPSQETNPMISIPSPLTSTMIDSTAMSQSFCGFCRNNGESEVVYKNHRLKDANGGIICPVLRAYVCPICSCTGDKAHTLKYCPMGTKDETNRFKVHETPRTSAGKRRNLTGKLSTRV